MIGLTKGEEREWLMLNESAKVSANTHWEERHLYCDTDTINLQWTNTNTNTNTHTHYKHVGMYVETPFFKDKDVITSLWVYFKYKICVILTSRSIFFSTLHYSTSRQNVCFQKFDALRKPWQFLCICTLDILQCFGFKLYYALGLYTCVVWQLLYTVEIHR